MKLRFGAAITVARPRLDDLGGGASYNVVSDTGAATIVDGVSYYWSRNGGGNPELEPWKANNFDLSFEKYFGDNKGYFAAAIYYKDIDTYIFNQSVDRRLLRCAAAGTGRPLGYVHVHHCGRETAWVYRRSRRTARVATCKASSSRCRCRSRCSRIRWMASASS